MTKFHAAHPPPDRGPVIRKPIRRDDRAYIYERDGHKCLRCGGEKHLTIDHVIPLTRGGRNHVTNYQTLCKDCNGWKGKLTLDFRWRDEPDYCIDAAFEAFQKNPQIITRQVGKKKRGLEKDNLSFRPVLDLPISNEAAPKVFYTGPKVEFEHRLPRLNGE